MPSSIYPIFYLSPTFPVPSSNTPFPRSHPPPIPTFTYASLHLLTLLFHHLPIPTPHSSCPIPHPLFYIPTPPLPPHPPLHLPYDPPIFLPLPPPPSPLPHHSNPKICSKPNTTMPWHQRCTILCFYRTQLPSTQLLPAPHLVSFTHPFSNSLPGIIFTFHSSALASHFGLSSVLCRERSCFSVVSNIHLVFPGFYPFAVRFALELTHCRLWVWPHTRGL